MKENKIVLMKSLKNKYFLNLFNKISKAKYLIRLDDACNTQKKKNWIILEKIFDELNIKPIVAVIPFNKDKNLIIDKKDKFFWDKVRSWNKKGWNIAMHGHSHLYHEVNKDKLILPFYKRSEFAGLTLKNQKNLIKESYNFFIKNEVKPNSWVSPSHTFDNNTLISLKEETGVKYISDGISFAPYRYMDFIFVPQQLWRLQKKLFGIWTICLHPNTMDTNSINELQELIKDDFYKKRFINIEETDLYEKKVSLISLIFYRIFWIKRSLKSYLKNITIYIFKDKQNEL